MKRYILPVFVFMALCLTVGAQALVTDNLTAASSDCSTARSCLTVPIGGNFGGAVLQLTGTWAATVQFEATANGSSTWVAISVTPSNSTTTATSATANGAWQVNVAGYDALRIRVSAFTSGVVVASINPSTASARSGSGAGGSGTIAGSIAATQVAFGSGANTIAGDPLFVWDNTLKGLHVGIETNLPPIIGGPQFLADIYLSSQEVNVLGFGGFVTAPAEFVGSAPDGGSASFAQGALSQAYATGTNGAFGFESSAFVSPGVGQTVSSAVQGLSNQAENIGAGTVTRIDGAVSAVSNLGVGVLTTAADYAAQPIINDGGGTLTNAIGYDVKAQTVGTNNTGIHFEDFGAGANNFGISQDGTSTKNKFAHITAVDAATGTSPPACVPGTAGVYCANEGTAPTGAASVDILYANATNHCLSAINNNVDVGCLIATSSGAALPTGNKIHSTGNVAAISTATLCASTSVACGAAGQYHISWTFIETGTACGTPATGGVTFLLTWTDSNTTSHSAVSLGMDDASAINAVSQTFHFQTSLAAAWASGDFNISTNGAIVQYATGYTACGVGTGTYQLDVAVTRLQ